MRSRATCSPLPIQRSNPRDAGCALSPRGFCRAPVRERFGLTFDAADQRTFERSLRVLRATLPRLPARLRYVPPYFEARRRIAGRGRVDWVGRAVTRVYLGGQ